MKGKAIFLKYWFIAEPLLSDISLLYYKSNLPGIKKGISGSMIAGCNIGITNRIEEDKKDMALVIAKYMTSKVLQKKIFSSLTTLTAFTELLYDKTVCEKAPCDIIKEKQFTTEPEFIRDGPENYGKRYQKYIYQYLYQNKPINETLKQINDITKIYYISLTTENSYVGLICIILLFVISFLMLISLIFPFKEDFKPFFKFLPNDLWIVSVLGSILILWIPIFSYGPVKTLKCHIKPLLFSIGYTLNICPVIYKLIIQFPDDNKISVWVNKHIYLFLFFNILIDIIINSISFINPNIKNSILIKDGENFEICDYKKEYSILILLIYEFLTIFLLLLLIFAEWNITSTMHDVRFIVPVLYIDILFFIFAFIYFIFKIKNYKIYFIVQVIALTIISISHYIFLYEFRLILAFIRKNNINTKFLSNTIENFVNNETTKNSENVTFSNKSNTITEDESNEIVMATSPQISDNFIKKIIDYHYSNK